MSSSGRVAWSRANLRSRAHHRHVLGGGLPGQVDQHLRRRVGPVELLAGGVERDQRGQRLLRLGPELEELLVGLHRLGLLAGGPRREVGVELHRHGVLGIGARHHLVGHAGAVVALQHVAVEVAQGLPERQPRRRRLGRLGEPLHHPQVGLLQVGPALGARQHLLDPGEGLRQPRVEVERLLELRQRPGLVLHLVAQDLGQQDVELGGARPSACTSGRARICASTSAAFCPCRVSR